MVSKPNKTIKLGRMRRRMLRKRKTKRKKMIRSKKQSWILFLRKYC